MTGCAARWSAAWLVIAALVILGLVTTAQAEQPATVASFPAAKIAGQTQAQVAKSVGQPDGACEIVKQGKKCVYRKGAVEIVFIDGNADWMTIHPKNLRMGKASLGFVGLDPSTEPDFEEPTQLRRWENVGGLLSVEAHGGEIVQYFHVKARTP